MSEQLVISVDQSGDTFRWCWLTAGREPDLSTAAAGDLAALAESLPVTPVQAWLIVPGNRVVTRELEYLDKEKKHLRTLLPFQMEETLIGDVDNFHFALGPLNHGKVCVAWLEKAWLEAIYSALSEINIEVTRCWSAPLTLPLTIAPLTDAKAPGDAAAFSDDKAANEDHWTVQLDAQGIHTRYASGLGFSIEPAWFGQALQLLLTAQKRVDHLPLLHLRAHSKENLQALREQIPANLLHRIADETVVSPWRRDYSDKSINLGQGEFSQRLPIERWWRNWRYIAAFAAACLTVHVGILLYQLQDFRQENIAIRMAMEEEYRRVVPEGTYVDAERQLTGLVRQQQPSGQGGSATSLLAKIFPSFNDNSSITIRSVQYLGDSGDVNMQLQATDFAAIEKLRNDTEQQGLQVELLSSSVQGNVHSARLKFTPPSR